MEVEQISLVRVLRRRATVISMDRPALSECLHLFSMTISSSFNIRKQLIKRDGGLSFYGKPGWDGSRRELRRGTKDASKRQRKVTNRIFT
jgi:hypothetical protein